MPAQFTIPSVFTAIDRFSPVMIGMGNAVQNFVMKSEAGMNRADRAFRRIITPLTSINKLLAGMGLYVGLFSVFLLFKNATNVMADFQQANVDLALVMETTVDKNKLLADQARRVGLEYGIAATEVSKLQYELATLGFKQPDILKMTKPIVTGSVALRTTPEELATTVGAVLQSFKMQPGEAGRVIDLMTKVSNETALTFKDLQTMLPTVSKPADLVNITLEDLFAHLGVLRNAQVHVATAGTSMKNMMIDTAVASQKLDVALGKIATKSNPLAAAFKKFDKRSAVSASVLSTELEQVEKLRTKLEQTQVGLADQIATDRLKTFKGSISFIKSAYQEMILSIEDGTGAFAGNLYTMNKTIGAMLLIVADSSQAREALKKLDYTVVESAHNWLTFIKWIGIAIGLMLAMGAALKLWALALGIAKVALFAYNVVLGISTVLMSGNLMVLRTSVVAMYAARTAMWVITAAQWAWNVAMAANPIGLIIIAIAALIGYLYLAITHWDEWGASVSIFVGALGPLLIIFQTIRRHWDDIKKSFTEGGFLEGIKAIGRTIFDMILMPMQQLVLIMGRVTGAAWITNIGKEIAGVRAAMGMPDQNGNKMVPAGGPIQPGVPIINPAAQRMQDERDAKAKENTHQSDFGKMIIEIMNNSGNQVNSDSTSMNVAPIIKTSMGY